MIHMKHQQSVLLTAEQWSVQAEGLWQVFDLTDPLIHGPGEVVSMVQTAQDDAGEIDWLSEVAQQRALETNHIPPERNCAYTYIYTQISQKF